MWRADYPNNATWFEDHYHAAPQQIVDFFAGDGVSLEGKMIADIGTGDGIMALGLFDLAKPELLVGYDVEEVDTGELVRTARDHGIDGLPQGLRFDVSLPDHVPAATGAFDFVLSWSTFEHAADPLALAKEMRRLLAPGGVVMIQLYPFYYSEHGDHGWSRPSFEHLSTGRDGTELPLNRITLDELHTTLWQARLRTSKVELICNSFHVPSEIARHKLTDLAIGGVKLIAVPF